MLTTPYRLRAPNVPIELFRGALDLTARGEATTFKTSGPGNLSLAWLPAPRLMFVTSAVGIMPMADMEVSVRGARLPARGRVASLRVSVGSGIGSQTTGFLGNRLARGSGIGLDRVVFHVANFPEYIGSVVSSPHGRSRSRVEISVGDWTIRLDCREGLHDILQGVAALGGYVVSHIGEVRRSDGAAFDGPDVLPVLEALGELLSFANGSRTYPLALLGYDGASRRVWSTWEPPAVAQYATRFRWLDQSDASCLGRAFDGLWARWADPDKRAVLRRVVYLATDANRRGVEPGLIVAQAALELLGWQVLVNETGAMTSSAFDSTSAAQMLRKLLANCRIPPAIPVELVDLVSWASTKGLADGPQALTRIRNSWVHPPKAGPAQTGPEVGDAWLLALWYVDLVTLWWLNYKGDYSARVRGGLVEPVPWA
jgi:hypothetical protein